MFHMYTLWLLDALKMAILSVSEKQKRKSCQCKGEDRSVKIRAVLWTKGQIRVLTCLHIVHVGVYLTGSVTLTYALPSSCCTGLQQFEVHRQGWFWGEVSWLYPTSSDKQKRPSAPSAAREDHPSARVICPGPVTPALGAVYIDGAHSVRLVERLISNTLIQIF